MKTNRPTDDCHVDENSSLDEISQCIQRTRRHMDETLQAVEQKISPTQIYDQGMAYFQQNYKRWLSEVPRRIKDNPSPFIIIGAGMLLGGAAIAGYALSKQRSSTEEPSVVRRLADKSRGIRGRARQAAPERKKEHYLRPVDAELFQSDQENQASTEEIYRSRIDTEENPGHGHARAGSGEKSPAPISAHETEARSAAELQGAADIYGRRLGEEQVAPFKDEEDRPGIAPEQPGTILSARQIDLGWANRWMQHQVADGSGTQLGTVSDVVSSDNSKADYFLIKSPDGDIHPVPAELLQTGPRGEELLADFDYQYFSDSPGFSAERPLTDRREWESDVRGYFSGIGAKGSTRT